jgi:hypothetical protein
MIAKFKFLYTVITVFAIEVYPSAKLCINHHPNCLGNTNCYNITNSCHQNFKAFEDENEIVLDYYYTSNDCQGNYERFLVDNATCELVEFGSHRLGYIMTTIKKNGDFITNAMLKYTGTIISIFFLIIM